MSGAAPAGARQARLLRELEHHRRIAERAEAVWNWESPAGRKRADRRAALFVSHAALGPGRRALELGCGTGVFLERVAPCGAEIHGLDLSEDLLARARRRLQGLSNVSLRQGDAEALPYPDASFDAVYGSSVLHHLDLGTALREAWRVLRSGGRLVFAEPNLLNPQVAFMFLVRLDAVREHFGVSPDEMAFTRRLAQRELQRAGYAGVSVTPFDFLHPATPAFLVEALAIAGASLERLPLVRGFGGSLLLRARKP